MENIWFALVADPRSMNPVTIPLVKSVLRASSLEQARRLAEEVMTLSTSEEIEQRVAEAMKPYFSDELLATVGSGSPAGTA